MSKYWLKLGWVTLSANFRGKGASTNEFFRQKTRVPGLSRGVVCVILCLAVLLQHRRVTQTITQTDWQTDTRWWLLPAHHYAARVKMKGGTAEFGPPCRSSKSDCSVGSTRWAMGNLMLPWSKSAVASPILSSDHPKLGSIIVVCLTYFFSLIDSNVTRWMVLNGAECPSGCDVCSSTSECTYCKTGYGRKPDLSACLRA